MIEDGAEMIDIFEGGLICKNYPDLPGIGVKAEWDDWPTVTRSATGWDCADARSAE